MYQSKTDFSMKKWFQIFVRLVIIFLGRVLCKIRKRYYAKITYLTDFFSILIEIVYVTIDVRKVFLFIFNRQLDLSKKSIVKRDERCTLDRQSRECQSWFYFYELPSIKYYLFDSKNIETNKNRFWQTYKQHLKTSCFNFTPLKHPLSVFWYLCLFELLTFMGFDPLPINERLDNKPLFFFL